MASLTRFSTLPPLYPPQRYASVCLLSASVLLSGCSTWPQSLGFGQDPLANKPAAPSAQANKPIVVEADPPISMPATAPAAPAPVSDIPASAAPAPVTASAAAVTTPTAAPAPVPPLSQPASAIEPPPPPPPPPTPVHAPAHAGTPSMVPGYYINVGLFANQANSQRVFATLERAGLPVFTESVQRNGSSMTRVRVGPFTQETQAHAAAKKIRSHQLDAIIFRHPSR